MLRPPIYLDHNVTTALAPGVLEVMVQYLDTDFGNPSSGHHFGIAPRAAVALARRRLAHLLETRPERIVFTGSGSESSTLAVTGVTAGRIGQVSHRPPNTQPFSKPAVPLPRKASG